MASVSPPVLAPDTTSPAQPKTGPSDDEPATASASRSQNQNLRLRHSLFILICFLHVFVGLFFWLWALKNVLDRQKFDSGILIFWLAIATGWTGLAAVGEATDPEDQVLPDQPDYQGDCFRRCGRGLRGSVCCTTVNGRGLCSGRLMGCHSRCCRAGAPRRIYKSLLLWTHGVIGTIFLLAGIGANYLREADHAAARFRRFCFINCAAWVVTGALIYFVYCRGSKKLRQEAWSRADVRGSEETGEEVEGAISASELWLGESPEQHHASTSDVRERGEVATTEVSPR